MGRAVRQKINKEIKDEQNYKPTIPSRHQQNTTYKQQSIHSPQVYMEIFLGETIYWAIKQNLNKL